MSFRAWPVAQFIFVVLLFGSLASCQDANREGTSGSVSQVKAPNITDDELRDLIDEELRYTFLHRKLSLTQHAAWQILHGALPFGKRFEVYNGDKPVPAIDWVLDGGQMKGWTARHGAKDLGGRQGLKLVHEPGTKTGQGHEDQWLAVISQSGYRSDHPVMFQGKEYQIGDIVQQMMWDVYEGKECSWTLIGLTRYLGTEYLVGNRSWKNAGGEDWNFERMMAMEANQNVDNSACGGTHRLIGMAMALKRYQKETEKSDDQLTGGWALARKKIDEAVTEAEAYQNKNGCFSTNYFRGHGTTSDLSNQINRSGHTLEVLALALDDETIKEPWVTAAVVNLCDLFRKTRQLELECGTLYHAAHGLIEYRERRFGPFIYPGEEELATPDESTPDESTPDEESGEVAATSATTASE